MTTKAQEWAHKRNFKKFQLMGLRTVLYPDRRLLTEIEWRQLRKAGRNVEAVIDNWEGNNTASKEQYLKEVG